MVFEWNQQIKAEMERRKFIRNSMVAAGGVLLGSAAAYRFLNEKQPDMDSNEYKKENLYKI